MRSFDKTLVALACASFSLAACTRDQSLPALAEPGDSASNGKASQQDDAVNAGHASSQTHADGSAALPDIARSTRSSLQWKRHAALESDLSQALELTPDEVCNEFGKDPCIRSVHLSPLGGHNPFTTGLLESSAEPLVTTSTVVERVVLSACIARREKDRALGATGVVFGGLDLNGVAPAPDDAATRALVGDLYKRFLARDAEPVELDALAALARDEQGAAVKADDFAATVCMAVGSSSEFLFF
ncbi:MAG: hypothetical protein JWN04_351 [Myxococcaceae bacterium]|nr:hypothetical protein [Myxococcaceae bacterium]